MRMYLISDNVDTLTGMRLAGIEGAIAHQPEEIKEQLDKVTADKDVGILLITEKLSRQLPEYIKDIKLNRRRPIIVEIPDRHGSGRTKDFITQYVKEAIGLKI